MAHEFVGAKLFPDRYERDRIICDFLRERNKTEVLKEALYRMAISEMGISGYVRTFEEPKKHLDVENGPSPAGHESAEEPADTLVHDVSLESLEIEEKEESAPYDIKAIRDNFLSSLGNVKF